MTLCSIYYQKLIRLRHEEDILTEGSYRLLLPEDDFAVLCTSGNIKGKSGWWQPI